MTFRGLIFSQRLLNMKIIAPLHVNAMSSRS